jgi:hypothetical protein
MPQINRTYLAGLLFILAALACEVPAVPTQDGNFLSTSAAQTLIAGLTQSAPLATQTPTLPLPTSTFTATFTPEPPTSTPTEALTVTPIFTWTPLVPLISVSTATNCRNGPGKIYGYEGALLVGETAEVIARDPTGNYWYIRNPDDSGDDYCWVWGKYATVTGNVALLPIYTPPPTPTPTFTPTPSPSFKVSYSSLDTCAPNWWIELKITNNGSISFKSVNISVKDKVTDVLLVDLSDGFTDQDGCLKTTTKDVIAPGDTYLLSGPPFSYDPTGHELRVTLTLCSNTGQKGKCISEKFDVKP